ncbi:MAG TPA: FliM/FliN family flagellar motor switch protein [Silvibacterium sp.]|nr:FliM/FliN family flagellar motor switch protein [Silvibacterium sp.]
MEKTLRQDEIDALFQIARARKASDAPESRRRVQPFSFSRAGQISNEQMKAISLLNDIFARNLTHNLGAWLRTSLNVNLVSAEQMPFSEFMLRIPELSYVCSVRLEPLRAVSVLQIELAPAPPMIDLLLGGEGAAGQIRELTDIEESILSSVVEVVCRELSTAWQPVGLSFRFDQRQMQTQIGRLMPVSEKTLCLSFEIRMPGSSGLMNLAFPAVVSNTVLRRLVGDWTRQRRHGAETRERIRQRVGRAKLGAALQLAPSRVSAAEMETLEPGKLLRLAVKARQPADLRIAGISLFQASPVSHGEHRGAHLLTRVP